MLRALALLLVAANLAFFAWTQGLLSPVAMPPMSSEREPERLKMQVRPELITLLDAQALARAQGADTPARAASSAGSAAAPTPASPAARSAR